jgi:hypothetical protein
MPRRNPDTHNNPAKIQAKIDAVPRSLPAITKIMHSAKAGAICLRTTVCSTPVRSCLASMNPAHKIIRNFATSLGWGVAVSAIPVAVYQASWTLVGLGLGEILDGYQIDAMTVVGGIMLMCIALRLLNIKHVAVGNLLPALAVAPVLALFVHSF